MAQSAINSASSSTRWIDAIVASMLTTTPFFRPREGCVPRPITLSAPSAITSATIATIFAVPMSSPTIRFLFSFTSPSLLCRFFRRLFLEARHPRREAVAVAEIDLRDAHAVAREHGKRAAVRGDEAREPRLRIVTADLDR